MSVIDSFYKNGSDGCLNLFERDEQFVVQWEGTPTFDSGYAAQEFETLAEARQYFEEERRIEEGRKI